MGRRPSSYLERILNEGKPRANAMDGWLLALVVFCLFAAPRDLLHHPHH